MAAAGVVIDERVANRLTELAGKLELNSDSLNLPLSLSLTSPRFGHTYLSEPTFRTSIHNSLSCRLGSFIRRAVNTWPRYITIIFDWEKRDLVSFNLT